MQPHLHNPNAKARSDILLPRLFQKTDEPDLAGARLWDNAHTHIHTYAIVCVCTRLSKQDLSLTFCVCSGYEDAEYSIFTAMFGKREVVDLVKLLLRLAVYLYIFCAPFPPPQRRCQLSFGSFGWHAQSVVSIACQWALSLTYSDISPIDKSVDLSTFCFDSASISLVFDKYLQLPHVHLSF